MEKIDSFTVDHNKLKRGIYVSRKDQFGDETITTFDIRTKLANQEPAMDIPAMHTMEHLGATFLRNSKEWADKTVYFGPMGCRTGFYIIFHGDLKSEDIIDVTKEMFDFMADFQGEIPGTNKIECGNYVSHDLTVAKWESDKYRKEVLSNLTEENLNYPQ
ncbi:S-ribosylhomocysteine lyase [Marinifilum flexuosum]|uniref:S-ribosylhomocysteine lyase n=1 Tax=Marinifilum flexuosum TaxID=1117708 RepID=A0A419WGI0_9BACT|nr:S-ribosylhomocysteine lyase [Marinifilum flexuosum]RKD94589.1 S-ribosylhomocysteine lyase /quorum-sensing autoinducer 2 (AI-2) synthesis protein LuxS [Marinifilum flexuosum]